MSSIKDLKIIDRSNFITLNEAVEVLGVPSSSHIINAAKYKPFYYPIKGHKNLKVFDINGFRRHEENVFSLMEKTKLFIEWLKEERGFTNSEIARNAGIASQTLYAYTFGDKAAYAICKVHKAYIPAFDEYYGWRRK